MSSVAAPFDPTILALIRGALAVPAANAAPTVPASISLPDLPPEHEGELLRWIAEYERLGWQLAPLRTYAKDGEIKQHPPREWPKRTGSILAEIRDRSNRLVHGVALVLGASGLADIDLDSDVARTLAPKYLRASATFGRKGRVTHYVYRTTPHPHPDNGGPAKQPDRRAFAVDGGMLLELRRGPGYQTTPPPTVKPDGHPAVWTPGWQDALITWEDADEQRVEDLALACVFVRTLERSVAGRQDTGLQFAGELARRGVSRGAVSRASERSARSRPGSTTSDTTIGSRTSSATSSAPMTASTRTSPFGESRTSPCARRSTRSWASAGAAGNA